MNHAPPVSARFAAVAMTAALAILAAVRPALANEDAPTATQVEQARRCAAETRAAGRAFAEVRDSVKAGGTTRAATLLDEADESLRQARAACRSDEDVSAQLELLAGEADGLRRSLARASR